MEEVNPFQSPEAPVADMAVDELELDYWRPIGFVFDSPNWALNCLLIGVCQLIPIVGPIVMLGYQYEIVIALLRQPAAGCPDFDFNRFGDYLRRGLMPFLFSLIFAFLLMFVVWLVMIGGMMLAAGLAQGGSEETAAAIMGSFFGVFILGMIVISIGMQMFIMPLALRAGLTKDFNAGMKLGYAFQFIGNNWAQMIVFSLVMSLAAIVAVSIGMLLLCIGQYFTISIVIIAQGHVMAQLYRLNCTRGGEVIPIVD